ncbi:MAG: hypothetical protein HC892_18405 [Saprospiraceae bacterium]|nr:hypothetical protein [Saprospiraceae bacterium]
MILKRLLTLIFICSCFSKGNTQNTESNSKFIIDSIDSKNLKEARLFNIYLPENFDHKSIYPIVIATDGQIIEEENYKIIIDSLISNKIIEPFILIGINSNETEVAKGITYRQFEYIKGFTNNDTSINNRYANHYEFFTKEIIDSIKVKFKIIVDPLNLTFYGCSNGGGYGITLFLEDKNIFKNFICFSPLGNIQVKKRNKANDKKLSIKYGDKELFILVDEYEKLKNDLNKKNYTFEFDTFNGGHDRTCWKYEFQKKIIELYKLK